MITASDFFCGAGGSSTGIAAAGVTVKSAVNHWKLAIETHNTNHPNTDHYLDDIQATHPSRYPYTDILWMSPECFPAGTLILTERGLIAIENVAVGDRVLTHRGRWMSVTATMQTVRDTIIVSGQGHYGIETTAEHPFYARQQTRKWDNTKRSYDNRVYDNPTWIEAGLLTGSKWRWATPIEYGSLPIPKVTGRGFSFSADFFWMVGRWLGDGSLRFRQTNSEITICCGKHEVDALKERLNRFAPQHDGYAQDSELRWRCREIRTSYLFETAHSGLAGWLLEHFGQHADGKSIPSWALTMPKLWRESLVEGYLSADGHRNHRRSRVDSISKRLILGVRLLAESLGYRASFGLYTHAGGQIEGRAFSAYDMWMTAWETNASQRAAFSDDLHSWSLVKNIEAGRKNVTVYNLSVEEDESYIAEGIVVHNCTNHSVAKGKQRKGIHQLDLWGENKVDPAEARSRATMREVVEHTEYHRHPIVVVENVVDIRHWQYYEDWLQAMINLGYAYKTLYLNAQFFGVPQSRDRWYTVFWKRGNRAPDLDFRPAAYCPKCEKVVSAIQAWKKPDFPWGRYGQNRQYVYKCPTCASAVAPAAPPAASVIDWSLPAEKIADRKHPLRPKTLERIRAGIKKFARAVVIDTSFTHDDSASKVRPLDEPLSTQTTRQSFAIAWQPFMLNYINNVAPSRPVSDPLQTIATRNTPPVVIPPFTVSTNHSSDRLNAADEPLNTVMPHTRPSLVVTPQLVSVNYFDDKTIPVDQVMATQTSANKYGILLPPFLMQYYSREDAQSSLDQPLPVVTTERRHSLIAPAFISGFYNNGVASSVDQPMPTAMAINHHGLVVPQLSAETIEEILQNSLFRMLSPDELKRGMSFPDSYVILGNQKDQVRQIGNAVCALVARWLTERCVKSLS